MSVTNWYGSCAPIASTRKRRSGCASAMAQGCAPTSTLGVHIVPRHVTLDLSDVTLEALRAAAEAVMFPSRRTASTRSDPASAHLHRAPDSSDPPAAHPLGEKVVTRNFSSVTYRKLLSTEAHARRGRGDAASDPGIDQAARHPGAANAALRRHRHRGAGSPRGNSRTARPR